MFYTAFGQRMVAYISQAERFSPQEITQHIEGSVAFCMQLLKRIIDNNFQWLGDLSRDEQRVWLCVLTHAFEQLDGEYLMKLVNTWRSFKGAEAISDPYIKLNYIMVF